MNLKLVASDPIQDEQVEHGSVPPPSAEAVFVQFLDGTTWGERQSARAALIQRKETAQEFSRLEGVLADAGEQALVNEFSSKSDRSLPCIRSLLDRCSGGSPSCLADSLRSVVETGKRRGSKEVGVTQNERPRTRGLPSLNSGILVLAARVAHPFFTLVQKSVPGAPGSRSNFGANLGYALPQAWGLAHPFTITLHSGCPGGWL